MNYMVSMSAVLGIAAVAFGISLIPGPNMFYLASRSITQGRGAGLISLAGVAVGFGVYLGGPWPNSRRSSRWSRWRTRC
jgi:threonine/homoserine/homoserine lactone efflux protein